MSQSSILDPVFFLVYVNDINAGFTCKISKFTDDTKITGRVTTATEKIQIESNLDNLVSWSEK